MNQIERLEEALAREFPAVPMEIDRPLDPRGPWFLFLRQEGRELPIAVEWRPGGWFGVSTPGPDDYGTGADEVFSDVQAARGRVAELLRTGGRTEPMRRGSIADLRHYNGLNQGQLAELAGVTQANVSQLERRGDVKVGTLARIVAALGGVLSVRVLFPNGWAWELSLGEADPAQGTADRSTVGAPATAGGAR